MCPVYLHSDMPVEAPLATGTPAQKSCAKCGIIKVSGKPSCCAHGGAWFRKCGKGESKKFAYTWTEGAQSCGGFVGSVSGEVPGPVRDQNNVGQLIESAELRSVNKRPTSVLKAVNASDDRGTDGEGRVEFAKFTVYVSLLSINLHL